MYVDLPLTTCWFILCVEFFISLQPKCWFHWLLRNNLLTILSSSSSITFNLYCGLWTMKQMHDHMIETGSSTLKRGSKRFNQCMPNPVYIRKSRACSSLFLFYSSLFSSAILCVRVCVRGAIVRYFGSTANYSDGKKYEGMDEIENGYFSNFSTLVHTAMYNCVYVLAITERTRFNHVYFERIHRNIWVNAHICI